jgi:hypothetical protein
VIGAFLCRFLFDTNASINDLCGLENLLNSSNPPVLKKTSAAAVLAGLTSFTQKLQK